MTGALPASYSTEVLMMSTQTFLKLKQQQTNYKHISFDLKVPCLSFHKHLVLSSFYLSKHTLV
jgi:hypothetical protein